MISWAAKFHVGAQVLRIQPRELSTGLGWIIDHGGSGGRLYWEPPAIDRPTTNPTTK